MPNPFGTPEMAAGYASARPPVHRHILQKALAHPVHRALDVGCGAGVSTQALDGLAAQRIGIEPAEAMLAYAPPGAHFAAASAEEIPFRTAAMDLITAAGSLNYVNLDKFFPEAQRILRASGALLVYDFSTGRSFPKDKTLDEWFETFIARHPFPASEAKILSPEILAQSTDRFRLQSSEHFEIAIRLEPDFYVRYMMTETNVAAAVRKGADYHEILSWCETTLQPVWNNQAHEVVFRGYYACFTPNQ